MYRCLLLKCCSHCAKLNLYCDTGASSHHRSTSTAALPRGQRYATNGSQGRNKKVMWLRYMDGVKVCSRHRSLETYVDLLIVARRGSGKQATASEHYSKRGNNVPHNYYPCDIPNNNKPVELDRSRPKAAMSPCPQPECSNSGIAAKLCNVFGHCDGPTGTLDCRKQL